MPNAKMIKAVINEYGVGWLTNRTLYSMKLKLMEIAPPTETWFEKKTKYPQRLDLFNIDVRALQVFIQRLDEQDKMRLIEVADKACEGIITGFSSIDLNYGNPIDWQLCPLTGKRCDENQKWYRIPDFDQKRGDIKVIWEASRFSHFITFARAYLLTSDEKYYKAFSGQLRDWLEKNPYGFGANFKCSQECSFRMVNTLLAFAVFQQCGVTVPVDAGNVKNIVNRCYKKIQSNFFYAYKCIKNNHTISELMGMIVGAWCACDEKQLDKAYKLMDEVINEQFTADGGYRQFSFNYQRLALQDLEVVLSIEGKTGRSLANSSKERIRNSALLMYQCQDDTGDVPNYGSNDGALIFPVTSCGYRDFRPVINTAYALTTGNHLYNCGKHQEELLWFGNGRKLNDFKSKIIDRRSSRFDDAGLFTIRMEQSWAMLVSNEYSTRPADMDQQHFDLWVNGVNVFCDTGTYSYASEEGRKLARNESHNTALVDGKTQMNSRGPFMIYDWTKRKLGRCDEKSYEGKTISANDYEHIRKVKQIGASYVITDICDKDYCIRFHTPCEVQKNDIGFLIIFDGRVLCKLNSNGEVSIGKSERSLYYLKKQDITFLSIKGRANKAITTTIEIC